jgi:hypothetical protein
MRRLSLLFAAALLAACDHASTPPAASSGPSATAPAKVVPGVRVRTLALPEHLATAEAVPAAGAVADKGKPPSAELDTLRRHLQELGFTPLAVDWSELDGGEKRPESVLRAAGLLVWFDVETGSFPNEHDALLRQLGAAAAGDLAGVVFEEIAPKEGTRNGRYRLQAYADGKRWSVDAQDYGDWYDVDAVLLLGNAVLRDRGSERRMLLLATEDQTAEVVVAPRAALSAALRDGLLDAGDAEQARELGRSAEEEVRAALTKPAASAETAPAAAATAAKDSVPVKDAAPAKDAAPDEAH